MAILYTERSPSVSVLVTKVADRGAAFSDALPAGRRIWAEFSVYIEAQEGVRGESATVGLAILPSVDDTNFADGTYGRLLDNYIVQTWTLDAGFAARYLAATEIKLPPGSFKVGLINETKQSLVATVKMRTYAYENKP